MTAHQPEPGRPSGHEPGRLVPPGETPPGEDGTSGISHPEPPELRRAWASAPLVPILLLVVLVAVGLIGMAVVL